MIKEKKNNISEKFFKLVNKYLKNETEKLSSKIEYYLHNIVNVDFDKIAEQNIRAYTEILIYLNENLKRIKDIWKINMNNNKNNKNEKSLIKNSFEILHYCIYIVLYTYPKYKKYLEVHNAEKNDYLTELKSQNDQLLDNLRIAINSVKYIEKLNFNNNSIEIVLEKYLSFLIQALNLYYLIINNNIGNSEIELLFHNYIFVLKNTTNPYTLQNCIKHLENVLCLGNKDNSDLNGFNSKLIFNWGIYLNENYYLQNRYKSNDKYSLILKFILRYYSYCLNRKGNNNQLVPLFKGLFLGVVNDKLVRFKNLMTKLIALIFP